MMGVENQLKVVGVMSGTSLDGLDLALVHFEREDRNSGWSFRLERCETIVYPVELEASLKEAIDFSEEDIAKLDLELGHYIGKCVNAFLRKSSLKADLVASHGHTVFHQPDKGISLQIGAGRAIFETTGIPVVNNFREADVQAGGQGAPLVPIGDRDLFADYDLALNLGGIANASFDQNGKRVAFDICPFNMALNELAREKGLKFDDKGALASKGQVEEELLAELNKVPYLLKSEPKSLGLEDYLAHWQPILKKSRFSLECKLATFVEHAAEQIAKVINDSESKKVLISGGGCYHDFFISRLRNASKAELFIPDKEIIEFKEALIFAYLGLLRIQGRPNCLASVTGAKHDVCGGDFFGA